MTKRDRVLLCLMVVVYSLFALYDLGSRFVPESGMTLKQNAAYQFFFPADVSPSVLCWFDGPQSDPRENPTVTVLYSAAEDSGLCVQEQTVDFGQVFTWQSSGLYTWNLNGNCLVITLMTDRDVSVMELVFTDENGKSVLPENRDSFPQLFDEQELLPEQFSFRNSMYFDEIYHARSAYEMLEGLYCYENTHPPLGKLLIGLGILMFGMNPFGWRIVGTLFGIAMLPLMYVLCKRMTRSTPLSALGCWLLAFDFMHFTQTRIATIDVYITFFVIAMYLFMYEYVFLTAEDPSLSKAVRPLLFCGLSMGLGVACKWTGVYAGIGLAVIFFASLLIRWRRSLQAQAAAPEHSRRALRAGFRSRTKTTVLLCVVFFVVAPVLIYMTSYLLFQDGSNHGMVQKLLENQRNMFLYHTAEKSSHTFASRWYEWPIMKKPIWYYTRVVTGEPGSGGLRENISAFGNPAVWWVGIPAGVYMLWRALARRDGTAAFLLTGYAAQYLPWCLISRTTFIYHYFPSVPFVVLMLVHSLSCWKERLSRRVLAGVCLVYGALAFGLFLMFYPVLSGQPAEAGFIVSRLRWLDTWVLTME